MSSQNKSHDPGFLCYFIEKPICVHCNVALSIKGNQHNHIHLCATFPTAESLKTCTPNTLY